MASRDKSQGFGFMYMDLAQLVAQRDEIQKNPNSLINQNAHTINFNKDPQIKSVPRPTPISTVESVQERKQAIHQIRENLDRLQSLHHKLHAMLEELNQITDDKKKS